MAKKLYDLNLKPEKGCNEGDFKTIKFKTQLMHK